MRMYGGENARRRFLLSLGALAVSTRLHAQPRFASYPFSLGVASGYPTADSVVLWTRLTGDLAPAAIPVRWEVFGDDALHTPIVSGETTAHPEWAHSVHVEAKGLEPERWYWYRFRAGDAQSAVGRTRTAPRAAATAPRLRFAFASCQQYEQGYYGAYRHIVADAPDLVAFLGDYIYESTWGRELVRSHASGETYTLADYRARYALYRSDPDLQAAHAACPWIVTWDDHEVDNDYADDRPEDGMERAPFLERRAAAYRAYYEHMPLPPRMRPEGPNMRIYTHLDWGALARFYVLDDRQYRSWHACPRPQRRAGSNTVDIERCARLTAPGRSILGRAQERWLDDELAGSRAAWNVIAQQTRMAQFDTKPGPGRHAWTDAWDGYPAARQRLLDSCKKTSNPVVLGGTCIRSTPISSSWTSTMPPRRWWRANSSPPRSPRSPGRRSASISTCRTIPTSCSPRAAPAATRASTSARRACRSTCAAWRASSGATHPAARSPRSLWTTESRARSGPRTICSEYFPASSRAAWCSPAR